MHLAILFVAIMLESKTKRFSKPQVGPPYVTGGQQDVQACTFHKGRLGTNIVKQLK